MILKGFSLVVFLPLLLFCNVFEKCAVSREIVGVLRDPATQWMIVVCLGIYFLTFALVRYRSAREFERTPTGWLTLSLLICAGVYGVKYSSSVEALVLFSGAVIGQGAVVFDGQKRATAAGNGLSRSGLTMIVLILSLAVASFWNDESLARYSYHARERWAGPWDNPNIFGLLMGAGLTLAIGGIVSILSLPNSSPNRRRICQYGATALCLVAAFLLVRGLYHSFSRGAWLATTIGLLVFAYHAATRHLLNTGHANAEKPLSSKFKDCLSTLAAWIRRNWAPLSLVAFSIAILFFWQFRHTETVPVRRAVSVANANDFSWRNRVAAWEGTLQIMAEHPWFGTGWNGTEQVYENYYLQPRLQESGAIQMNSPLLLGARVGIPALVCFGIYFYLSLTSKLRSGRADWLAITCRAGAIVLLVGFWFDGGLFKLPTAATFWILLELGSANSYQKTAEAEREK